MECASKFEKQIYDKQIFSFSEMLSDGLTKDDTFCETAFFIQ